MNFARLRLAALAACTLLAAPALAAPQDASESEAEAEVQAPTNEEGGKAPSQASEAQGETLPEAKEEKRICRRIRLDMSSRRGTRVCKTADEWREFNQRR
ncbi:hypothetical protein [Erythrobacter sp.]|jgi:hypothetical protein|uniref:hypothetical protein n=1 Tax=Erythrobacter sp. TaxID=1042 RepID=UPI002EC80262|nr:hypothetical protein [Erythrobacter sp.]